ncbi:sodium-dependent transporter [Vibrio sp. JCM 19236]|nr:sodium-dependent transporter [Vibrio sp. JCM 19236]
MDYFTNQIGIVLACFIEVILVVMVVKAANIRSYVNNVSDFKIGGWYDICLKFVSPAILAITLFNTLKTTVTEGYGGYAQSDLLTLGWGLLALLVVIGLLINTFSKKEA